jgi:eukaryotic-like serine/threonine-protein kinase
MLTGGPGMFLEMSVTQPLLAERYRLVRSLGQGGMGRVWLARDEVLHRDVAIKEVVPPAGLTAEERNEMRLRTMREARAAARLNHPSVVRVYDVVQTDMHPWIVMEYVPARSLHEIVNEDGTLPPNQVAQIGLQVLGALRAAHRAGVLHRDVKPSNVLLADNGRVVLTDFGLATMPGEATVTRPGMVLGSPAYIAPERAREGHAGPESDLWSLGATLYAAVEGNSPYQRSSAIATLTALVTEEPPPAKHAGPLRQVLSGLLRKDPTARIDAEHAERLLRRAAGGGLASRLGLMSKPRLSAVRAGAVTPTPLPPGTPCAVPGTRVTGRAAAGAALGQAPQAGEVSPVPTPPEAPTSAAEQPAPAEAQPDDIPPTRDDVDSGREAVTPERDDIASERDTVGPGPEGEAEAAQPHATGTGGSERAPAAEVPAVGKPGVTATSVIEPAGDPIGPTTAAGRPVASRATGSMPVPAVAPEQEPTVPASGEKAGVLRRPWLVAAGVVALALLTVTLVALPGSEDRSKTAQPPKGAAPTAATSGAPTAPPSPSTLEATQTTTAQQPPPAAPALPEGWQIHNDPTGFSVAAPVGWNVSREGTILYFRDPNGGRVFGIDQSNQPHMNPVADWTNQERQRAGSYYSGYQRIRIAPVNYFVACADWEFTYDQGGTRAHVINRGFVTSDHQAYGIWWSTPESAWQDNLKYFQLITSTFKPKP